MKFLRIIFAFILLIVLSYVKVSGEDRISYGRSDKYTCFYDPKSIARLSQNVARVVDYQYYTKEGKDLMTRQLGGKYENLSHTMTLWEINCAEKRFRFLSLTHYSKENNPIYSWKLLFSSDSLTEWNSFTPGSLGENLYKAVCK
jgi:hypothetical protein